MSRISDSVEALATLNGELQQTSAESEPLIVEVTGRPKFFVPSFSPLVYESYTRRNRAPQLAGKFALVGFMWTRDLANDLVIPYSVVRAEAGLQFGIHASNQLVVDIGKQFGIELQVTS